MYQTKEQRWRFRISLIKTNTFVRWKLCGKKGGIFSLGLLIDALPIVGYLEHVAGVAFVRIKMSPSFDTFRGIFDNVDDDLLKQCAVCVDTDRKASTFANAA